VRWRVLFVALALVGLAFTYGFVSGSYRLFPFYQIAWVKNALFEEHLRTATTYVPERPESVAFIESTLQRLLVKRVPLPNAQGEFAGGGAMTRVGDILYVFTSGGTLLPFDLDARSLLASQVNDAPINRAEFMRSPMRYQIHPPFFRLVGAHAESASDSTHVIFTYHNRYHSRERCFTANVSRVTVVVQGDTVRAIEPWRTIFTSEPCLTLIPDVEIPFPGHISGGKMIEYDEERLLLSVGDFAHDVYPPEPFALDPDKPYGKFLLLDKETGEYSIYASGMRNAMGLYRDLTGVIWATESGPQGGDELNIVERGMNFGWPLESFGIDYGTQPWPLSEAQGRHDEFDPPVIAWLPSIVPTNLVRLEGPATAFDLWRGDLVLGTLRDQSLRRLRPGTDGRILTDERIFLGERIRDLLRLDDGTLVLLTDGTGHLMFLGDGGPVYEPVDDPEVMARIVDLEGYGALTVGLGGMERISVAGDELFVQKCASCHSVDGRNMVGPHLNELLERRVGGLDDYSYSSQLAFDGRPWTPALLSEFLLNPESGFVDMRMPKIVLSRAEADSIIAYLQRID
jgi:aldose sugar dehydrogenase